MYYVIQNMTCAFLNIGSIYSISIITIGASTIVLFCCTLKMHKYGDCNTFKDFFKSFRQNFVQSALIWILMAVTAGCIYLEYKIIPFMPGMRPQILSYILLDACIALIMIALYVFPMLAAFDTNLRKLIADVFLFCSKIYGLCPDSDCHHYISNVFHSGKCQALFCLSVHLADMYFLSNSLYRLLGFPETLQALF